MGVYSYGSLCVLWVSEILKVINGSKFLWVSMGVYGCLGSIFGYERLWLSMSVGVYGCLWRAIGVMDV